MNSKETKIVVCLATYNGAKFIEEFLDCLREQTVTSFTLVVRDDGSTDETLHILQQHTRISNFECIILKDKLGNLGPAKNFIKIIKSIEADIYFLADQDDKWKPNKIETFKKKFELINPDLPAIIFSDFELIDDKSNYIETISIKPRLNELLFENQIPGCTMAFNRSLSRHLAKSSVPNIMHDWWIILVLHKLNGNLIRVDQPLISYRQHESNTVGWGKIKRNKGLRITNKLIKRFHLFRHLKSHALLESISAFSYFTNFLLMKIGLKR